MTRDDAIRMLKDVVERYANSGSDDHYISDVRDSCEVAFNAVAAEHGWEPVTSDDLR
jgi:hypothetical protein